MLSSFNSAISGINSNSQSINIIGNNLANINTTSFKTNRVVFAELLGGLGGTSDNGNPQQIGLGSTVSGITTVSSQGTVQYTGRATDVAINGSGYFVVANPSGGEAYTRAGSFSFSPKGDLLSSDGFNVLAYPSVSGVIDRAGGLVPVTIFKGAPLPSKATANISLNANLDSRTATNSTYATNIQTFDSLGVPHNVTVTFTKTGATAWNWTATIPAVDTGGSASAAPVSLGNGSITFDASGNMTAPTTNPALTISGLASGAAALSIEFGVLDSSGKPRLTGYASESTVASTTQDGYQSSVLKDINITNDGTIQGIFDNGQVRSLFQLATANFLNPEGLLKSVGSTFIAGPASGEPAVGAPGFGGRGTVSSSSLEQSNVDIATEFTNLIISQRGYQANSKVITTTDQLYQDVLNLIR